MSILTDIKTKGEITKETVNNKIIIALFKEKTQYILTFDNNKLNIFNELKYSEHVDLNFKEIVNFEKELPEGFIEELVFEVIYNIRIHACSTNLQMIEKTKLIININFINESNTIYLIISNNHNYKHNSETDYRQYNTMNYKNFGLVLLQNIIKEYSKQSITTQSKDEKFTIKIPLT